MFNFLKKTKTAKRNYEAGQTNRHNANHWRNADNSDANSLISADLETVRNRCRYEIRNNSYASGIVHTLANDIVGTGPMVEFIGQQDQAKKQQLEDQFIQWSRNCDFLRRMKLDEMLRLDIVQLCEAGNSLALPIVEAKTVKLLPIESDRLRTPYGKSNDASFFEGIKRDQYGRPLDYYIAKHHPGDTTHIVNVDDYDIISAEQIIHLFRVDRPGQIIGMPWITPALPLFADLRDFTAAVLKTAKRAAGISAVTVNTTPEAATEELEEPDSYTEINIPSMDAMLHLSYGRDIRQFKAEQPVATYQMFKEQILGEIARCLHMPFGVAACNSSGYNYASGQLDQLPYYRSIEIVREWIECHKLDPIIDLFLRFVADSKLLTGMQLNTNDYIAHWKGREHSDPVKMANANKIMLETGQKTMLEVAADKGTSYQRLIDQRLAAELYEKDRREELGLTTPVPTAETEETENENEEENQKTKSANAK